MARRFLFLAVFASCCPPEPTKPAVTAAAPKPAERKDLALPDEQHLKNLHQLTFGADNAEATGRSPAIA